MTEFKRIPHDLYRQAEPQAGEVWPALTGRLKSRRPREQFEPNWSYLLSGRASPTAVVAGLYCGHTDVPEHVWPEVMRMYCPTAWGMLTAAEVPFTDWQTGHCDAVLSSTVAAIANTELDHFNVFAVIDVPVMVAEIVGTLGGIPRFE